jgi:putative peptide zinc metalloprotease protein
MSTESTTTAVPDWLDRPVELAPQVTLIDGANGHSMLFNAETGTYVRLSQTGARVVPLLDGTRTGAALLEAASRSRGPDGVRDRAPVLLSFLSDLRAAGVLSEPPEPLRGRQLLLARFIRLTPHVRFPARHLNLLLRPPAAVLARFPRILTTVGLLICAAAAVSIILAMTLPAPMIYAGPPWLVIGVVLLVQATVHEMGHATVCQSLGVPVREAGVKFFCLLIPLTYVDRTDAYRLRSRRSRCAVALVGPGIDLAAAGLSALLIVLDPVRFGELRWLLGMQLFLIVNNLNPLLPVSDGHHAMEAALGELNLRHRAFTYLGHVLFRLPLSGAHKSVSAARRRIYLTFGIVSGGYLAVVLAMIAMNYYRLFVHATT